MKDTTPSPDTAITLHPPQAPPAGLVRGLGIPMATAVVVGCVIGSGIFKKPQSIAENLPRFDMVAAVWIAGGLLALLGSLTMAEVAVLFPRAGGNYVFLREGYGRWAGFLWGWVEFLVIKTASQAALATMFAESFHDLLRETMNKELSYWQLKFLVIAVIVFPAWVNIRGVRWGGGLQLAITVVKMGSLLAIMLLPWVLLAKNSIPETAIPTGQLGLFMLAPMADFPGGLPVSGLAQLAAAQAPERSISLGNFLSAFVGVLWAYHGWMNLAPVAGEVRRPQRNIPIALLGGVVIVIILYLGCNLAYYQVLPMWEMPYMGTTTVANVFSVRLLGSVGGVLMPLAIMFSVFGALNGNLLTCPRLLYAMGEDGLVPRVLGEVHPRYHTPAVAIAVMAVWSIALVLGVSGLTALGVLEPGKGHFDVLTEFAMFGAIIFETLALTTIFVFRRTLPNAPRPYRCWGYPVVPLLYLIMPVLVVQNMLSTRQHRLEAVAGAAFMLVGAIVYFFVVPRNGQASQVPDANSDMESR